MGDLAPDALKKRFDYAVMIHGDGQYAPEEIPNFISKFNDESLDAVFGSRMISYKSALKGGMPFYKYLGNKILTFFRWMIKHIWIRGGGHAERGAHLINHNYTLLRPLFLRTWRPIYKKNQEDTPSPRKAP